MKKKIITSLIMIIAILTIGFVKPVKAETIFFDFEGSGYFDNDLQNRLRYGNATTKDITDDNPIRRAMYLISLLQKYEEKLVNNQGLTQEEAVDYVYARALRQQLNQGASIYGIVDNGNGTYSFLGTEVLDMNKFSSGGSSIGAVPTSTKTYNTDLENTVVQGYLNGTDASVYCDLEGKLMDGNITQAEYAEFRSLHYKYCGERISENIISYDGLVGTSWQTDPVGTKWSEGGNGTNPTGTSVTTYSSYDSNFNREIEEGKYTYEQIKTMDTSGNDNTARVYRNSLISTITNKLIAGQSISDQDWKDLIDALSDNPGRSRTKNKIKFRWNS